MTRPGQSPSKADARPGSRWYAVNRDRTIAAFVVGSEPMTRGGRIVNTHNDSVHLALKPQPFRDSFDIMLFDTTTHGALKNYQWVNRPLALLRCLLRLARDEWEVITKVPQMKLDREPRRMRWLRPEEAVRLLDACRQSRNTDLANLVEFCMFTGTRRGEALGLTWARGDRARRAGR